MIASRKAAAMGSGDAVLRAALAEVAQLQETVRRREKQIAMLQQHNHMLMNKLEIVLREVASGEPLTPALVYQAQGWVQSLDERRGDE